MIYKDGSAIMSASTLLCIMLYLLVGLLRTIFKTAYLHSQGKISARNDDRAALLYMIKNPTLGDLLFLPVQLFLVISCLLVLGCLNLFLFVFK